MRKVKNYEGIKFGRLTVVSEAEKSKHGRMVNCKCECGNETTVLLKSLVAGDTKSCGCYRTDYMRNKLTGKPNRLELTNQRFRNTLVLRFDGLEHNESMRLCLCECGKLCRKSASALKSGRSFTCGCGHNKSRFIHGGAGTRLYNIYIGVVNRCNNKEHQSYNYYGGRGLTCERKTFQEFKDDMATSYREHCEKEGEYRTSLDRIDNDKGYSKENCRWATPSEQVCNRRRKYSIPEIAKVFGLTDKETKDKINNYFNQ